MIYSYKNYKQEHFYPYFYPRFYPIYNPGYVADYVYPPSNCMDTLFDGIKCFRWF